MAPTTVTVEWVGEDGFELWSGYDHGEPVTLNPGEPADVSSELATHLSTHFGHLVSIDGAAPAKKRKPAAAADPVEEKPDVESLTKLGREKLNEQALALGIENAADLDAFKDKRALATAIVAVLEDEE